MTDIRAIYLQLQKQFSLFHTPIIDLIEAQTKDPFKILVGTILSARTNDKTTTQAVNRLFSAVNDIHDLELLSSTEIEKLIYPVGFYHQKALYLKQLPTTLNEKFNGLVPEEIDELTQLPGVGRKTANLVRALAFKKPAICVDVHVHRICNRIGYIQTKTPKETEFRLREILPLEYWITFNSYLVAFGQNHCTPLNPQCSSCDIYQYCQRINVKTKWTHQ